MLFYILLCILSTISDAGFSRTYLRDMKRLEEERYDRELIDQGFKVITDMIFTAAKEGHTEVSSPPFEGCTIYSYQYHISIDRCQHILSGIENNVRRYFGDSDLLYNDKTKKYTLKWD